MLTMQDLMGDDNDDILSSSLTEIKIPPVLSHYTIEIQTRGKFTVPYQIPSDYAPRGKTVLVVPETHLTDNNIGSRMDYVAEMKDIHGVVEDVILKLKPDYTVYMGEIFHRGFTTASGVCYWFDKFIHLNKYTTICCVKGNHEDSFKANNPFWYMANGAGVEGAGVITLPNNLVLNDVALNFEHFGIENEFVSGKKTIGFMHTDIMTPTIREFFEGKEQGGDFWVKDLKGVTTDNMFQQYDLIFDGHMHKKCAFLNIPRICGRPLQLCYMGSLGRTNVTEVDDSNLQRQLYIIDCYDGNYDVIPIPVYLPNYDSVVNVQQRIQDVKKQKMSKEKKEYISSAKTCDVNKLAGMYIENEHLRAYYEYLAAGGSVAQTFYDIRDLFERSKTNARNSEYTRA